MPNKIIKKTNQIVENQNENSIHYAMLLFTQLQMTLNTPNNQRKEKKQKCKACDLIPLISNDFNALTNSLRLICHWLGRVMCEFWPFLGP